MGNTHLRGTELGWTLYSARQGIRSLPTKHIWKNRQNRRLVLVPHDQYRRALTVKMKDRKPVIKMVTPVEHAIEMAMAELKRDWDALKPKKQGSLLHDRNHIQSRTGSPFETLDDTNPSTITTLLSSSHPPGSNPYHERILKYIIQHCRRRTTPCSRT